MKSLYRNNYDEYDYYLYSVNIKDGSDFANCCGSSIWKELPKDIFKRGIGVVEQQVLEEENTETHLIKHVQTKNGVITVGVQKKWR